MFAFVYFSLLISAMVWAQPTPIFTKSVPIWHPLNKSAHFVFLRSPQFTLPSPTASSSAYLLHITARQSPNLERQGNSQGKLACSFKLQVNGAYVTAGPGHNLAITNGPQHFIDTASQAVAVVDVTAYLSASGPNVLAISSYFNGTGSSEVPFVQAELCSSSDGKVCAAAAAAPLAATGAEWQAWQADLFYNPAGDNNGTPWYIMPNENLDQRNFPTGWAEPTFEPLPGQQWVPALQQTAIPFVLYLDSSPPAILTRKACNVTEVGSGNYLIDFGQEFSGGVNLTFAHDAASSGATVIVTLGEALHPNGTLQAPTQADQYYHSVWTLAGQPNTGTTNNAIMQHEMIQFRYALVQGTAGAKLLQAAAWVLQHAVGGTGLNPFELPCAHSAPTAPLRSATGHRTASNDSTSSAADELITWHSSLPALDRVFNFTAYTIVSTSFDINVDSRTRQRDLCQLDAFITLQAQHAIFGPRDVAVQRRTALFSFSNASSPLVSATEFRLCAALMVHTDVLESGSLALANATWSSHDHGMLADSGVVNSLQFYASLMYFNLSGRGLLSFPASCLGPWSCAPLVDWPVQTRDGYVTATSNTDDAIRNSLGLHTIRALGDIAGWLGHAPQATQYHTMADTILQALGATMLRFNASNDEAYVVDGTGDPAAAAHSAIQSTIYAAAAGLADGNATLAAQLSRYLIRRDLGPSSCMTGKWVLDACYRLAVFDPVGAAADYALQLLSRTTYPSWGYMLAIGATTTLEAWRPADKWNTDWAHPWCASPAYAIPRLLLGMQPLAPGWARLRIAPQPSTLEAIQARIPSPQGSLVVAYSWDQSAATVQLDVGVLRGQTAQVCLVLPSAHAGGGNLFVDGVKASTVPWGRMLCTSTDLAEGQHSVRLI